MSRYLDYRQASAVSECSGGPISSGHGVPFHLAATTGFQLAGGGAPVGLLLDEVAWSEVLDESKGPISCEDFNAWHKCQTEALCDREKPHLKEGWSEFPVGWSVKLINIYLKTVAYVGNLGRPGLRCALHPPLDSSVKKGLMEHFKGQPAMVAKVDFGAIKDITTYERYRTVIDGCEVAAKDLRCSLFEVEHFFSPMGPASHNPFLCYLRSSP